MIFIIIAKTLIYIITIIIRCQHFEKNACDLCGFVECALVRLVGEQDVADCNRVAFLLLPRRDDAGFNALTLTRHDYYVCHELLYSFRDICDGIVSEKR